jgi:hypothetical protein
VVVRVGIKARRRSSWSSPRAGVLLAGMALLPDQSGGIALLLPSEQLRAVDGWSGGLGPQAIDPAPYGSFQPLGAAPQPALAFGFSWNLVGLPEAQGSDSYIAASLDSALSDPADQFGVAPGATGSAAAAWAAIPTTAPVACGPLLQQLQTLGEFWNSHSSGGSPVELAPSVSTDPVQGPTGDPANLGWQGPAGAWCRARPLPFSESSPLASRVFWTPVGVVLFGLTVFWLSRGFKLPR